MSKITTYAVTGKVVTGFSHLMVANYAAAGGSITYSNARVASGAVDVTVTPDSTDKNNYYTDNATSESAGGKFTGGTAKFTVKGLAQDAERMIYGLPAADTNGWTAFGDSQSIPYLGVGFVVRSMCSGADVFTPIVLAKAKFDPAEISAKTQEDDIDWQSQSLSAKLFRGDDTNHNWRFLGDDWTTEAEAITQLETKLGITQSSVTQ